MAAGKRVVRKKETVLFVTQRVYLASYENFFWNIFNRDRAPASSSWKLKSALPLPACWKIMSTVSSERATCRAHTQRQSENSEAKDSEADTERERIVKAYQLVESFSARMLDQVGHAVRQPQL